MLLVLSRPAWTAIAAGGAVLVVLAVELLLVRTVHDRPTQFGIRRSVRFATGLVVLLALAGIWHVFGGHIGLVVGLGAAGLGFVLQNVIGAVFGWMGILVGGVFRIGDRISFAGVEGDVIDLTPLRTVILEMGSPLELGVEVPDTTWVPRPPVQRARGRRPELPRSRRSGLQLLRRLRVHLGGAHAARLLPQ